MQDAEQCIKGVKRDKGRVAEEKGKNATDKNRNTGNKSDVEAAQVNNRGINHSRKNNS